MFVYKRKFILKSYCKVIKWQSLQAEIELFLPKNENLSTFLAFIKLLARICFKFGIFFIILQPETEINYSRK